MIMKPVLLINLKAYAQGTGGNALNIAKEAEALINDKVEIIIAAQAADIRMLSRGTSVPVFAQHVDPVTEGSRTGWILPESVKEAGAVGTLLNHSERQMKTDDIRRSMERCRKLGLRTVVCAATPEKARELASMRPDYIAIEPPELIGGGISVSKARPDVIRKSVEKVASVGEIPVLCGAGVKDGDDVEKAIELGADGVLVASGVVKSENAKNAMTELLSGF